MSSYAITRVRARGFAKQERESYAPASLCTSFAIAMLCLLFASTAAALMPEFDRNALAVNGTANAQIVVGAYAPGKIDDLESAGIIKDAVAEKLAANVSVASNGTWLNKDAEGYREFLSTDIFVRVIAQKTNTPNLEIRDEAAANKTWNLVLVGGPAANNLTFEMVAQNKSKINWYASKGDIEIISDAYAVGKYVIMVAGSNRNATREAAEFFAASL